MQETVSDPAARPMAPNARPKALRSVDEALGQLLAGIVPLSDHEMVATAAARGRVIAEPLQSRLDVPAADNSQMDGYAVRRADLIDATPSNPIELPVTQRIPAGHVGRPLAAGTVARIFTGALMPDGADAVVMQESVETDETTDKTMTRARFSGTPAAGEWVRRRGEDIRDRQIVLDAGTRLGPAHLGLAASIGTAEIAVVRRPRVAIFSTGDELAMPGEVAIADLKPGSLYNSNRFTLRAAIESLGCEVVDLGIVPDTLAATRDALVRAAQGADVIVTSGGVSVGEEDHMRPAVSAEGSIDFWQIAIKPGKPLAFGRVRDALFVGLPGNPVSSFVTFLIFVRPLLMRLQGIADVVPRSYRLRADFDWGKPDKRQEFLRVRINDDGGLDLFAQQGSAVMTSTVWADGLLDNPPSRAIARGDLVPFIPFAELLT
jgi:molybdopterin molybdotransferase